MPANEDDTSFTSKMMQLQVEQNSWQYKVAARWGTRSRSPYKVVSGWGTRNRSPYKVVSGWGTRSHLHTNSMQDGVRETSSCLTCNCIKFLATQICRAKKVEKKTPTTRETSNNRRHLILLENDAVASRTKPATPYKLDARWGTINQI